MVTEAKLEALGRAIMSASVTAEFLGLPGVVSYLDMAFADVVQCCVEERRRAAVSVEVVEEELVEGL